MDKKDFCTSYKVDTVTACNIPDLVEQIENLLMDEKIGITAITAVVVTQELT